MKSARIGDVIEVRVPSGWAYAQYTHEIAPYGSVIRVFDEIFNSPQCDFDKVSNLAVRFSTFFPINAAAKQGFIRLVGSASVAPQNRPTPWFRAGTPNPVTRRVEEWLLWRGGDEYLPIGKLSEEHLKLPILGIWNIDCLTERIETGWRPETALW